MYNPASQNPYIYAYNNPVIYTDPSGEMPQLLAALLPGIIGGLAGFAIGAAAGGTFGYAIYPWALTGECGCDMQEMAIAAGGDRAAFSWAMALPAGILGGIGGAMAAYGPIGLIAAGGLGVYLSGRDFIQTWNIIKNETGITPCTASRLLLDVVMFALSVKVVSVGIYKGVRAWKGGGSLLKWVTPGGSGTEGSGAGGSSRLVIKFGHGARHLEGLRLSRGIVESAIETDIQNIAASNKITGSFFGRIQIEGIIIEYRAFPLRDGTINVGTYYVPKIK